MAEPTIIELTAELETLRNAELLQAKHTLKARIATLEGEAATLESRTEKAETTMRAAVIDVPMKKFAAEVSNAPELFLSELAKDYDVVPNDDGTLRLLTKDGKEVAARNGKPLEWTRHGLYALLAGLPGDVKTDSSKVYSVLMRPAMASGGAGRKISSTPRTSSENDRPETIAPTFGLR
jgi:hypothetical protein